jgi:hypothetical protein
MQDGGKYVIKWGDVKPHGIKISGYEKYEIRDTKPKETETETGVFDFEPLYARCRAGT